MINMPKYSNLGKSYSYIRMAFFYAAIFTMIGIHLPFWPVWLEAQGLSTTEIGAIFASSVGIKVFSNPLITHFADRQGSRRPIMITLAILSFVTFYLFGLTNGFWQIMLVTVFFFAVWAPLMPLGESLAMLGDDFKKNKPYEETNYGIIRLWGSLTFIITAIGTGYILTGSSIDTIYYILLSSLALVVAVTFFLPATQIPKANDSHFTPITVIKDRQFILFITACALIQSSHSVYYGFGTLNWKAQGYSEITIGWLWAEGVFAEIILFMFGALLVKKIGPLKMIILGGFLGTIRWLMIGKIDGIVFIVILQALHAFTFGATHLGAIYFINRKFPSHLSASAQGIYSTIVMGVSLGIVMFASGKLYGVFGTKAYYAMALLAACGTILALFLLTKRR